MDLKKTDFIIYTTNFKPNLQSFNFWMTEDRVLFQFLIKETGLFSIAADESLGHLAANAVFELLGR
jgi:ribosomal protein L28